ncbi:Apoptosis inhibitory [Trema orientale]|uniref:Apoptosis inhibitory n=1 Tax=Trema orientale TaxID=63057 RepID=A0A2P5G2B6_TREOI|nr:Apoptosis inhibitory [Trema orientale]
MGTPLGETIQFMISFKSTMTRHSFPPYLKLWFFPNLFGPAINTLLDLIEIEEYEFVVQIRAIWGLPLFCEDMLECIAKIMDVLELVLATLCWFCINMILVVDIVAEEFVELDAGHKTIVPLIVSYNEVNE